MWDADLRVSVDFMDDEHAQLRATLNELGDVAAAGYGDVNAFPRATRLLELLRAETERHFAHEEEVMRRYAYPLLSDHVLRHTKFLRDMVGVRGKFAAGLESEVTFRVVHRLQLWFARHILTSDVALAEWLTVRGCLETELTASSWLPPRVSLW